MHDCEHYNLVARSLAEKILQTFRSDSPEDWERWLDKAAFYDDAYKEGRTGKRPDGGKVLASACLGKDIAYELLAFNPCRQGFFRNLMTMAICYVDWIWLAQRVLITSRRQRFPDKYRHHPELDEDEADTL
jgi:hypothetical protein